MTATENNAGQSIRLFEAAGRPFSGRLIAPPDDPAWNGGGACYCAQGLVLHEMGGVSDDELRQMNQSEADLRVAKQLGISRAESVLLRQINDSQKGCPQRVLELTDAGIGSILGSEWKPLISFWRHLDTLDAVQWDAAGATARAAAGDAAWNAAGAAAGAAAWNAAGATAGAAAGASAEIMGASKLTKFFFLPAFGFAAPSAIPITV